ncbi:MAG: O-antigen ligase family protein [Opitutaceae bacterium]
MPSSSDKKGLIQYFGDLSWGNFVDWLVTFCVAAIIGLFTVSFGGVRADTHVALLPLFILLLVLHGIWLAVDQKEAKRLSLAPILFIPFLVFSWINIEWLSPTPWIGRIELIYAVEAFILFWVLVNNIRTRKHLWVLLVLSLAPGGYVLLVGFYQFFQNPEKIADTLGEFPIQLSTEYLGQSVGTFGDPNSMAVFLLMLLPSFMIAAFVPRLPNIHRIFCGYVSLMLIVGLTMTKLFWPLCVLSVAILIVSSMCFRKARARFLLPLLVVTSLFASVAFLVWLSPQFGKGFEKAISSEGEAVRFDLWSGAISIVKDSPIVGHGGGAFSQAIAQSDEVFLERMAQTPHNDFLLLITQYGFLGFSLLMLPVLGQVFTAFRRWLVEPARAKFRGSDGVIMPQQKFFQTIGIASFVIFFLCGFFSFSSEVPGLIFCGVLFFAIMVKSSSSRRLVVPRSSIARWCYLAYGVVIAFLLYAKVEPRMLANASELQMRQQLDYIVEEGVHISGNKALLKEIIYGFEDAKFLDPENVDALIGLSAANCQRYFQDPSDYKSIGETASLIAKRATELSPDYALAWAQLGISLALTGDYDQSESALLRALELAPNDSNIHYYWASLLSNRADQLSDALRSVNRSLELNPNNEAARRLQQKLLIL